MSTLEIRKERAFTDYAKGEFVGSSQDMSYHTFDAYRVDDELHLVYTEGHAMVEKIQKIKDNMDDNLWTLYVMFL